MNVLVVGAGVIGTVYGAQLAASGHSVAVLDHGARTNEIINLGLVARNLSGTAVQKSSVRVVADGSGNRYDLVLVWVWAEQIQTAIEPLRALCSTSTVVVFGNNPRGRSVLDTKMADTMHLGFPGIGGSIREGVAEYVRIPQQPTTFESGAGPIIAEFRRPRPLCRARNANPRQRRQRPASRSQQHHSSPKPARRGVVDRHRASRNHRGCPGAFPPRA
jgi:Ketopantoate reductase PanE/ApbA